MFELIKKYWNISKEYRKIRRKDRWFKFKEFCSKRIRVLEDYINRDTENRDKYQDLTPKDDLENGTVYIEMLDWAIENEKIANIALTGPYGAGKSSILKTYEKKRTYNHYLNISLASFCNGYKVDSMGSDALGNEEQGTIELDKDLLRNQQIEKSILQQLFYKVKPSRIPYTRFRKLKNTKLKSLFIGTTVFIFTAILAVLYVYPNVISIVEAKILELKLLTGRNIMIDLGAVLLAMLILFLSLIHI